MAKGAYKIPSPLDTTYLDMEIAIQSEDGVGLKPLPIKIILSWICSIMLCFFVCTKTFISEGGILLIPFVLLWISMTIVLCSFDGSKRMQLELIPVLLEYLPKANRLIGTRKSQSAGPFYRIAGIESIDEKTGMVHYIDDTYGYWFRVVGSASVLLFDSDKEAIINRVDSFYRKMGMDCEVMFMTSKEAQKIHRQMQHLEYLEQNLDVDDEDLKNCLAEQKDIMQNFVGHQFKSIHQYMLIKGDNREALSVFNNVVVSELENSTWMIKRCVPMYKDDVQEALRVIYSGD